MPKSVRVDDANRSYGELIDRYEYALRLYRMWCAANSAEERNAVLKEAIQHGSECQGHINDGCGILFNTALCPACRTAAFIAKM